MEKSNKKKQSCHQVYNAKTFSVPYSLGETKENITITTNIPSKPSREQIMQTIVC